MTSEYGKFLYGAELYGDGYSGLAWGVEVDWTNDGVFSGSNEAWYMLAGSTKRGRTFFLKSDGTGFEPVDVGELTIELGNDDGRYDPYNTSSPLYPNVKPGRAIKIRVRYLTNTFDVFTGYISDIRPGSSSRPKTVIISALTAMQKLKDIDVSMALQTLIPIDTAITSILTEADFTSTSIEPATDYLGYWWVEKETPFTAIQKLVDASLGSFFISSAGVAKYYSRNHTAAAVLTLDQNDLLKDVSINQPWDVIKNKIEVISHPRVLQASAEIWRLYDTPSIGAGETLEIWANFMYGSESCPAQNVITPASTTDWLVNTNDDGSGTNITAACIMTFTSFAQSAKIVIKNYSTYNGYIYLLKVRGSAITSPQPSKAVEEDSTSISVYGKKTFTLDSEWIQSTNTAIGFAKFLKTLLADPRAFPVLQLQHQPDKQFIPDLFDRMTVTISDLDINTTYQVGYIEHSWGGTSINGNCQDVFTKFNLEPYINADGIFWQFSTQIGISSYFAF